MADITLPEITIVGDPDAASVTMADWWANGFVAGYNAPSSDQDRPLMISDTLAESFAEGVVAGRQVASDRVAELEAELADQPSASPDDGTGESFEKAQEEYNRLLEELFHTHMPHTDPEHMEEGPIETGEFNRPMIRPVMD